MFSTLENSRRSLCSVRWTTRARARRTFVGEAAFEGRLPRHPNQKRTAGEKRGGPAAPRIDVVRQRERRRRREERDVPLTCHLTCHLSCHLTCHLTRRRRGFRGRHDRGRVRDDERVRRERKSGVGGEARREDGCIQPSRSSSHTVLPPIRVSSASAGGMGSFSGRGAMFLVGARGARRAPASCGTARESERGRARGASKPRRTR